jgi:hypothetical protein
MWLNELRNLSPDRAARQLGQRGGWQRPRNRPRLELLEERTLLSDPGTSLLSASSTITGPSAQGEQFVGSKFNVSPTVIGGFSNGFGADASLSIGGNVGLDVGYDATLGSVMASYPDIALDQTYTAPLTFGQEVNLITSLAYLGGSVSTQGLSADAYANLDANISGNVGGTIEAFAIKTSSNTNFSGSLNDQPLFYIGIGPTTSTSNTEGLANQLGVTLKLLGVDLSDELSDIVAKKSLTDLDIPLFESPPVSTNGALSVATNPIELTQDFTLEDGQDGGHVSGSLDLGSLNLFVPDIDLSSSYLLPNGALSNSQQGEIADLNLQRGALAASALGASLGLPEAGALGGTETITIGSASVSFTPVSFELSPTLFLEQIGTVTPRDTLTYNFSSPVVVTMDGQIQYGGNPESSVTFTPGVDTVSIQDPGVDPITVTPTWTFGMTYSTELDLNLDLLGTLTVGELTASIDHVGSLTLGPLYQDTFDFANAKRATIWSDRIPLLAPTSETLPSFTILALPPSLVVKHKVDDGKIYSLSYAVGSANEKTLPQIIELGPGIFTWDPANHNTLDVNNPTILTIQGAGAGQTIIDASVLDSQILAVESGASLTLEGITLENGTADDGGAISKAGTLTVSDSAFSGDSAGGGDGGAIDNQTGTMTVSNSTFSNDTAGIGGAIFSVGVGANTIDNSIFINDTAVGGVGVGGGGGGGSGTGGAIYYYDTESFVGLLDLEDGTLSNDPAIGGNGGGGTSVSSGLIAGGTGGAGEGGGLYLDNADQQALLMSDTFNSDSAQGGAGGTGETGGNGGRGGAGGSGNYGGGIFVSRTGFGSYMLNDTLSGNSAQAGTGGTGGTAGSSSITGGIPGNNGAGGGIGNASSGGGLDISNGTVDLANTLIALNNATTNGPDVFGTINLDFSQNNLVGNGAGSNLSNGDASGDLVGYTASQLQLGPLSNNGGPTQTMALLPGSPAIAAGNIYPIFYGLPVTDQRGLARTVNGHVDIGAVEYQYDLGLTGSVYQPSPGPDFGYIYEVTNNGPDSVADVTLTVPLPDGIAFLGHMSPGWMESDPGVGDSGTVAFTYPLLHPGHITATSQNNAATAVGAILTSTATVGPGASDVNLQNNALSLTVTNEQEGLASQNVELFHFTDPNATANDFSTLVQWGDGTKNSSNDSLGTVSVVADPLGGFDVLGSHTYAEEGYYSMTLTLTDLDGTQFSSAAQQLFAVADAPLTAGALTPPPNGSIGQAITTALLFHFTDANPDETPSDFTATLAWGDGMTNTSSDGSGRVSVVAGPAGGFNVLRFYTYDEMFNTGTFEVQVSDAGGASTTASTPFYVLNAELPLSAGALNVPSVTTEGQSVSNQLLFQFSDPEPDAQISDYLATVYWGDGSIDTSQDGTGTVWLVAAGALGNGNLRFDVFGSHTFVAGSDYFGVEVTGLGGPGQYSGGQIVDAASAAPLTIIDPPLVVTAGPTLTAVECVTSSVQTVATFTDPGIPEQPDAVPNPYLATVEWGDGSITAATGLAQADYRQPQPESFGPVLSTPVVDPVDGNLAAGTYYYAVTSLLTSTVGSTTTLVESAPSNEVSGVATTIVILGKSYESEIVLSWQPVTGAAGYRVYRGTSLGSENTLIDTITSGTTDSFADTGSETTYSAALPALPEGYVPQAVGATASGSGGSLADGTYYYTITSTLGTLESTPSDEVFATTTGSTSEVALTWSQVPGATGYKVYRGTATGDENVLVATIAGGTTLSFSDTGMESTSAAPQEALVGHPLMSVSSESVPTEIVLGSDGQTYSVNLAHQYAAPGIYTITILLDHDGILTPGVTTSATVFPTNPTVDVTDSGGTYNGSPYTASATVDGAANEEGVSPTLQYFQLQEGAYVPISSVPVHVGSYEVTATFARPVTGYTSVSNTTTFTITPFAFTYQIGSTSQTYGTAANLASVLGTTISTGVNDDTLAITYSSSGDSATAHVQAGAYAITGALSNGTGLTNDFSVTVNNGALRIYPYAFAYTIANDHRIYGAPANLATGLAATIATGVNGQALDIAYASVGDTGLAQVAGSPYPIMGTLSSGTGLTSDYSVALNSGALTVHPAPLTITA